MVVVDTARDTNFQVDVVPRNVLLLGDVIQKAHHTN
jgi:hypothetical protein